MTERSLQNVSHVIFRCTDLDENLAFFTREFGFRIHSIFPADRPRVAVIDGYGLRIRLERGDRNDGGRIRLFADEPERTLTAPNGVLVEIARNDSVDEFPEIDSSLTINKQNGEWVTGRAGMRYRDLIPGRLGGAVIASHIHVPDAGPVPDYVHFHDIGFQMIYCYKGWARLVYEDQGEPFVLAAGDCVLQPPMIRHRVLESSGDLEVIEISSPAEHVTYADNEMDLPTAVVRPERKFGGQRFVRHVASEASWAKWKVDGFECRDTGIGDATKGLADVKVVRPGSVADTGCISNDAEDLFLFVLFGGFEFAAGEVSESMKKGDSVVIPDGMEYRIFGCSNNLEILSVTIRRA